MDIAPSLATQKWQNDDLWISHFTLFAHRLKKIKLFRVIPSASISVRQTVAAIVEKEQKKNRNTKIFGRFQPKKSNEPHQRSQIEHNPYCS